MNCFRFVSLKDWTQFERISTCSPYSCELLSICIFERLNTVNRKSVAIVYKLWIAFDLYLWKIEHSMPSRCKANDSVVNCFRFVSLKDWTQLIMIIIRLNRCCELLSICIFERLNTVQRSSNTSKPLLWIALDLYLWNIEHSKSSSVEMFVTVVNCSRFVSLKYWTQQKEIINEETGGCELLSICIFEILNTAVNQQIKGVGRLWIALDLYLWNIEHSNCAQLCSEMSVVNCSRFVSLKDWTQQLIHTYQLVLCCELLSICIFERLNTALLD